MHYKVKTYVFMSLPQRIEIIFLMGESNFILQGKRNKNYFCKNFFTVKDWSLNPLFSAIIKVYECHTRINGFGDKSLENKFKYVKFFRHNSKTSWRN